MLLDVIIPTYNRADMLGRTLESLLAARVPAGLTARVTVVDNNSKDGTRRAVEREMGRFGSRLGYVFEGRLQGRSPAINAGVEATSGELVAMIDDDEEVDAGWLEAIAAAFADPAIDFIGGPCLPRWGAERPDWFPEGRRGVVGWVDDGDRVQVYGPEFPGMLMGGNSVFRRETLRRVGLYATHLGRTDKHLLSCEDEDMYHRLLAAGAHGEYRPDLVIYHYVPPERLTRSYFRRWCFWRGVSAGVVDRERRAPVAYFVGVPRWILGRAARAVPRVLARPLRRGADPASLFADELDIYDFVGFFYGKHFYRAARPVEGQDGGAQPQADVA